MAILVDTSVIVELERAERPHEQLVERIGDADVAISAITASDLLHGVHRADSAVRRARRERFVEALLSALPVLPFDLEAARVHSRIWADLRQQGESVGAHDLIIAATAISCGANSRVAVRL